MKRYELIVIGAGPAGLSAAIEAAKEGVTVAVFDENHKPGGQLFKQIHKFFGSKEHKAKIRGFRIGEELLEAANKLGVEVILNAKVVGIYDRKEVLVNIKEQVHHFKADSIIIATGASENMVPFKGWTLPGVIGAGAAQTMMNLHNLKPGKKVLMLGSGNVGVVVGYQLLQAGCEVVGVVDALPRIGGYGVHAAKLARNGVPFYLSHTIVETKGDESVETVKIAQIDKNFQFVEGTEKNFEVDTICMAVGLSPMSQLCKMAGCKIIDDKSKGGVVPVKDKYGETSIEGIFVAGDVSGIEEASSAMIEGKIAGTTTAYQLGYIDKLTRDKNVEEYETSLGSLRQGMFSPENKGKIIEKTDEGINISQSLLEKGFLDKDEVEQFPGVTRTKGIHPVIECTQNIPCNPCQDACNRGCIMVGKNITALPSVDESKECINCGMCVANCSGQAIFLIDEEIEEGFSSITMAYEFLPRPKNGEKGIGLNREGKEICEVEVLEMKISPAYNETGLLTLKVPQEYVMDVRQYKSL